MIQTTRRAAMKRIATGGALLWTGCAGAHEAEEPEVTPMEDLVREHGLLQRILLVYDEAGRRIATASPIDVEVVAQAAGVVRRFVEDYHERTEETHVFPALEHAHREVELVRVLREQHQRGRQTTDAIVVACASPNTGDRLAPLLAAFARMYRPHAAREDTVLFPAFRDVVGSSRYHELGERFEEEEHARFGPHGFEDTLAEVARMEGALGIGDLASFT